MFKCNYIWNSLQILPNAHVVPCCVFIDDGIKEISLNSVHNSNTLQKTREIALKGDVPSGCDSCFERAKYGDNRIQNSLTRFNNDSYKIDVGIEQIQEIDLRMGNVCNFMCLMCNGKHSHLIANEEGFDNKLNAWSNEEENAIIEMLSSAKGLKRLWLAGGEPFYNKRLFIRILHALDTIKSQVELKIITNGSIYDEEIANKMSGFKRVNMGFSIDSTSNMNEIQRWNANNEVIYDVMNKYISRLGDKLCVTVNPVITNLTFLDLPSTLDFFDKFEGVESVHVNFCKYPDYLDINTIKKDIRDKVAHQLKNMRIKKTVNMPKIIEYIENVKSTPFRHAKFVRTMENLRQLRGLNVPSEIYDILEK